jgi:dTDP-glucose 4,6-dehydratase
VAAALIDTAPLVDTVANSRLKRFEKEIFGGWHETHILRFLREVVQMRALVTGGAGFLGSHLCDALIERGDSVHCVDNLLTGRIKNLRQHRDNPRFTFLQHDICVPFDPGAFDYVFHLASPASPFDYLKYGLETLEVGSTGTRNILSLAQRYEAKYLVSSTSECYGDPHVHPQPETYWGNVNPIGPRSVYDEAKRFTEALTMAYHRYQGVDTRILRIFNTYGPRLQPNDGRVISTLITQALRGEDMTIFGDGSQTRSFCYVSDQIAGILKLADSNERHPVNIGNPDEFTILECANLIKQLTGTSSAIVFRPLPQDDPKQRKPDISKAKVLLGWTPEINLRSGLLSTIEFMAKESEDRSVESIQEVSLVS